MDKVSVNKHFEFFMEFEEIVFFFISPLLFHPPMAKYHLRPILIRGQTY